MRLAGFVIAGTALALATACGGGESTAPKGTTPTTPTSPTTPTTPATPATSNAVSVSDNFFDPANIQVAPGTTVTWTWTPTASAHNVTFADGVNSGDKGANATYSRTFGTAGTFSYTCTLHGGMNGTVLVKQ